MRKIFAAIALATAAVVGPVGAAGASHTGCEHGVTAHAHASVPHLNGGTHNAHQNIPYCPPEDAPRHAGRP